MAINFDNLPDSFSNGLLGEGWHLMTVKHAEMRTSKAGAEYMSITLNGDGANVFDILMDSDKPALQFKLKQFIKALKLKLHGEFELRDLCKLIVNKQVMACINVQKSPGYPDRNGINIFDNGGYKPVTTDDELPFNIGDDSPFEDLTTERGAESY